MTSLEGDKRETRDDGGAAFPTGIGEGFDFPGMSLRDWFAGMALQGLLAQCGLDPLPSPQEFASLSYEAADAMLVARAHGETP